MGWLVATVHGSLFSGLWVVLGIIRIVYLAQGDL
jgi:hypothetical protein